MRRSVVWLCGLATLLGFPVGASGQRARISGSVYDSLARSPLAGATVVATPRTVGDDTPERTALTDGAGDFVIDSMVPGRYVLSVEHPALDSTGQHVKRYELAIAGGDTAIVELAVPSADAQLRMLCGEAPHDTTQGVYAGVVLDATDERPLPGATVVVQWMDFSVDSSADYHSRLVTRSAVADARGAFRVCGVPVLLPVSAQAQLATSNSGIVTEQLPMTRVLLRVIRVASSTATEAAAIRGHVATAAGKPIAGARLQVPGASAAATSGEDGSFTVAGIPPGTSELQVLAVGYYPERRRLELGPGATDTATVTLLPVSQVLEEVRVTAERRYQASLYRDFEEHRAHGHGAYLTAADIARKGAFRAGDALVSQPHVWITVDPDGVRHYGTKGYRGESSLQWALPGGGVRQTQPCTTPVVLDGVPLVFADPHEDPLDAIPASDVYGIEIYRPGEVPGTLYGVNTSCGLIVVWTKGGRDTASHGGKSR